MDFNCMADSCWIPNLGHLQWVEWRKYSTTCFFCALSPSLFSSWIIVTSVSVLQQFVVSIDCNDPFIRWQMEKGLDWTISSVAGESYRVDIDVAQLLESWAEKNTYIMSDELVKVNAVWRDTSFTLKYYSDALFDFPHWFGFSKRRFTLRPT
ncbi:uncharacterized protein V6R79_005842 [Siganus canaliculatus]